MQKKCSRTYLCNEVKIVGDAYLGVTNQVQNSPCRTLGVVSLPRPEKRASVLLNTTYEAPKHRQPQSAENIEAKPELANSCMSSSGALVDSFPPLSASGEQSSSKEVR